MKNIIILICALLLSTSALADKDDRKDNKRHDSDKRSAIGNKELLNRIEALETIVGELSESAQPSSDVSNGAYLIVTENNHLWASQEYSSLGLSFSVGTQIYEFYPDGSGLMTVLSCNGNRLVDLNQHNEAGEAGSGFIVNIPEVGCAQNDTAFTYLQEGAYMDISFPEFTVSWYVSADGANMVATSVYNNLSCGADCPLETAGIHVVHGMRLWDL